VAEWIKSTGLENRQSFGVREFESHRFRQIRRPYGVSDGNFLKEVVGLLDTLFYARTVEYENLSSFWSTCYIGRPA